MPPQPQQRNDRRKIGVAMSRKTPETLINEKISAGQPTHGYDPDDTGLWTFELDATRCLSASRMISVL